jgi:hypothetical protein
MMGSSVLNASIKSGIFTRIVRSLESQLSHQFATVANVATKIGYNSSRQNFWNSKGQMKLLYVWNTRIGPFYIAEVNGRFHPMYDDELLGSYATAQQAVDDLAGGHTFSISGGVDSATLGIPDELGEWDRV